MEGRESRYRVVVEVRFGRVLSSWRIERLRADPRVMRADLCLGKLVLMVSVGRAT